MNGQASCAHGDFTNGVVRGAWGWPHGFVVTDGNGIGSLWSNYGPQSDGNWNCTDSLGATGPPDAVRLGLRAGVDVELGATYTGAGAEALADGNITIDDVYGVTAANASLAFRMAVAGLPSPAFWLFMMLKMATASLGPRCSAGRACPQHRGRRALRQERLRQLPGQYLVDERELPRRERAARRIGV